MGYKSMNIPINDIYYELNDGSIWSVKKASFIDKNSDEDFLLFLQNKDNVVSKALDINRDNSLEGLLVTLRFYDFPLGQLEDIVEEV